MGNMASLKAIFYLFIWLLVVLLVFIVICLSSFWVDALSDSKVEPHPNKEQRSAKHSTLGTSKRLQRKKRLLVFIMGCCLLSVVCLRV